MAISVIKPTESIQIHALKVYIYGDPSMGKTSLAMTCPNALLIDSDQGVYRAGALRRADVQPGNVWQQVNALEEQDLIPYETIVIDTVGRLLEVIRAFLSNNKQNTKTDGSLKLNVQGTANNLFTGFVNRMISYGKNVVFVAHSIEDKDGDEVIKRPDLGGKNRQEIYRLSDCMAYFTYTKLPDGRSARVLKFGYDVSLHTKDCAQLGTVEVPDLAHNPTFLGDLIEQAKTYLNTLTPEQAKVIEDEQAWLHWQKICNDAQYISDFNNLLEELPNYVDHPQYLNKNMWYGLQQCAKAQGFKYDRENKRFVERKDMEV